MSVKPLGFVAAATLTLFSLSLLPAAACAQSQGDTTSVAEAARRAREQKKPVTKPVRTLTDDDLPHAPAAEVKPPAAPTEQTSDEQASRAETASGTPDKKPAAGEDQAGEIRARKLAEAEAALKQAKEDLALSEHELDVLQRKAVLDSDSYYSQTNYKEDTAGKAKLDADGQDISGKKDQVDKLKAKIAELEAEIAQLGGEPEKSAPEQPK